MGGTRRREIRHPAVLAGPVGQGAAHPGYERQAGALVRTAHRVGRFHRRFDDPGPGARRAEEPRRGPGQAGATPGNHGHPGGTGETVFRQPAAIGTPDRAHHLRFRNVPPLRSGGRPVGPHPAIGVHACRPAGAHQRNRPPVRPRALPCRPTGETVRQSRPTGRQTP